MPVGTTAHSTYSDKKDVEKVLGVVLDNKLFTVCCTNRAHASYPKIHFNPLNDWDRAKTVRWIEEKKVEFMKYKGTMDQNAPENDTCTVGEIDED